MTRPEEVPLAGGRANFGSVVRIGDQVARPRHPQADVVEHFLGFLRDNGADFVPQVVGCDDRGRQRLGYIEGRVAVEPYPEWAFDDALLVDVARRQRHLHRLARDYDEVDGARWAESAGDYFPASASGRLVAHNDLCVPNVVCAPDSATVVGIIDFDYAAPVDPLFDIAVAARHWVPFDRPLTTGSAGRLGYGDLDRVGRFGAFCAAHELGVAERERVVDLAIEFLNLARVNVAALARSGRAGFQRLIEAGYEADNLATVGWIVDHRPALAASVQY